MLKGQAPHQGLAEIQTETQANDTPIQICIVLYAGADVRSSDQRCHAHCRHEAACATELESNSITRPYALATRHPEHRQMLRCSSGRVSATLREVRAGLIRRPNWWTSLIGNLGLGVGI
jgi:hypothetical protein